MKVALEILFGLCAENSQSARKIECHELLGIQIQKALKDVIP